MRRLRAWLSGPVSAARSPAAVAAALEDVELAAELPDPGILDDYEAVVPGARDRLLRLRHLSGSWDEVGIAMWSALRQVDRELRHEVPGWPGSDGGTR